MVVLHQYIFAKVYYFYVRVFKEKEIPHWFASIIVCIVVNFWIMGTDGLLYYFYQSDWLDSALEYLKYLGLFFAILAIIYVSAGNRYKGILSKVEELDKPTKKRLGIMAVLYVLSAIAFVIITANLSRAAHLGEI